VELCNSAVGGRNETRRVGMANEVSDNHNNANEEPRSQGAEKEWRYQEHLGVSTKGAKTRAVDGFPGMRTVVRPSTRSCEGRGGVAPLVGGKGVRGFVKKQHAGVDENRSSIAGQRPSRY